MIGYALEKGDAQYLKSLIEDLKIAGDEFFKDYDKETEQKLISVLFKNYYDNIPPSHHPEFFKKIKNGNFDDFAKKLIEKSLFADKRRFNDFLENPNRKILRKDIGYKTMHDISEIMISNSDENNRMKLIEAKRKYIEGLMEMDAEIKNKAPDANSTLRLSYSKVKSYEPKDGVIYKYYTTLDGVMEKENDELEEFFVDDKLEALYNKKDFGRYADKNGKLRTCFINDGDITGGNSGSPVINKKGHLVGIAFDGNYEAMSGDIDFEEKLQRCINVDIRYVLWIIDKYAKAHNIIEELIIIPQ